MKFHFSGICGAGMGNVAMLLKQAGHEVKGSDQGIYPPMSDELEKAQIPIFEGYQSEHLQKLFTPDVQVLSNVLSKDSTECVSGRELGLKVMSFPEVLAEYCFKNRDTHVVAGTHGKTTTSSVLAKLLEPIGAGYLVGGIFRDGRPGCDLGADEAPFVIEGDEYGSSWFDPGSKFLHYRPKVLILSHLEWDHLDIFPTFDDMKAQFHKLLEGMHKDSIVFYCGDVPALREILAKHPHPKASFGLNTDNDVCIASQEKGPAGTRIHVDDKTTGENWQIETAMFGDIYLKNVISACLAARHQGLSLDQIQEQLHGFQGMKRRLEKLRDGDPFYLYNDFAHHPTAIRETLQVLRDLHPGRRITLAFDPRNASSRRNTFHDQFVEALGSADRVIIGPTRQDQRLSEAERLDIALLARDIGPHATGCHDENELVSQFRENQPEGSVIALLSCGAFFDLAQRLQRNPSGNLSQE